MPLSGFGNYHQTEAIAGALPTQQNAPQTPVQGLFTEQLSGSAFTRARQHNLHSWLYRRHPSVLHEDYQPAKLQIVQSIAKQQPPNPLRWSSLPSAIAKQNFLTGLFHLASNASAQVFLYQCHDSMQAQYMNNYDGDLLFIPYTGDMILHTEFGKLSLQPGHIAVIPRGVFFKVDIKQSAAGYVCENKGEPFVLPELGFMGANALANPRHFIYPDAAFETEDQPVELFCKYQDQLFIAKSSHTPLNVVAWQGNLAPYSYDLSLFNTINTVSFDHPDPSIYTVLTSPSHTPGVASLDFVIFPPRWSVAEHTFRPPYFHRNIMSELMGLIHGEYEAKQEGFLPGGVSIHNRFTPHGPDYQAWKTASSELLNPNYINDTLAFMLESCSPWQVSELAMQHKSRQKDYTTCWQGF